MTWLDWMNDHGMNLSQEEGLAIEDLLVQTLKEMETNGSCPEAESGAAL